MKVSHGNPLFFKAILAVSVISANPSRNWNWKFGEFWGSKFFFYDWQSTAIISRNSIVHIHVSTGGRATLMTHAIAHFVFKNHKFCKGIARNITNFGEVKWRILSDDHKFLQMSHKNLQFSSNNSKTWCRISIRDGILKNAFLSNKCRN